MWNSLAGWLIVWNGLASWLTVWNSLAGWLTMWNGLAGWLTMWNGLAGVLAGPAGGHHPHPGGGGEGGRLHQALDSSQGPPHTLIINR